MLKLKNKDLQEHIKDELLLDDRETISFLISSYEYDDLEVEISDIGDAFKEWKNDIDFIGRNNSFTVKSNNAVLIYSKDGYHIYDNNNFSDCRHTFITEQALEAFEELSK